MTQYSKMLGTKSLLVIISDFLFDPEELKQGLLRFGNHTVKVIQVLDSSEKDLKLTGDVKLKDAESEQLLRTFISPRLISQYEHRLENHVAALDKTCADLKANFFSVTTDTPIFESFYKILS